jgi:hypothetical protein
VFGELHGILLTTKYTYLVNEGKKIACAKKKKLPDGGVPLSICGIMLLEAFHLARRKVRRITIRHG